MVRRALILALALQIGFCPIICRLGPCSCCDQASSHGKNVTGFGIECADSPQPCDSGCCCQSARNVANNAASAEPSQRQDSMPPAEPRGNSNCVCHGALTTDRLVGPDISELQATWHCFSASVNWLDAAETGCSCGKPISIESVFASSRGKCAWLQSWSC